MSLSVFCVLIGNQEMAVTTRHNGSSNKPRRTSSGTRSKHAGLTHSGEEGSIPSARTRAEIGSVTTVAQAIEGCAAGAGVGFSPL
jgi:hypothetical protein